MACEPPPESLLRPYGLIIGGYSMLDPLVGAPLSEGSLSEGALAEASQAIWLDSKRAFYVRPPYIRLRFRRVAF